MILVPPGNRLEVKSNDNNIPTRYRVCFEWRQEMAWNVEIVDYHK